MKYIKTFKSVKVYFAILILFILAVLSCTNPVASELIGKGSNHKTQSNTKSTNKNSNENTNKNTPDTLNNPQGVSNPPLVNKEEADLLAEIAKIDCTAFTGAYDFNRFYTQLVDDIRFKELSCAFNSKLDLKTILGPDNKNLLHSAAEKGDLKSTKLLVLLAKINLELKNTADGNNPLLVATRSKHLEIIKYLVEHKSNIEVTDVDGLTPLLAAAMFDSLEVVRYLVSQHAIVTAHDQNNNTACDLATGTNSAAIKTTLNNCH